MAEPDYEIELTEQQLSLAVGDYCSTVLGVVPAGIYPQTQLSVITDTAKGTLKAVFRVWGPPKPIPPTFARVLLVTPSAAGIEPPRYERTEEIDES